MQDEAIHAERCLRAGARGYITKQQASRHVMQAIRRVLEGGIHVSDAVAHQMLSRNVGRQLGKDPTTPISRLADRELQVFELIGKGHSTRQIGDLLGLDIKTIETYRARIKEKLGLKDAPELLKRAIAWAHDRAE